MNIEETIETVSRLLKSETERADLKELARLARIAMRRDPQYTEPFPEPAPTVKCKCGWAGVGIQTKVGLPAPECNEETGEWSHPKPRCPKCKRDQHLVYIKHLDPNILGQT